MVIALEKKLFRVVPKTCLLLLLVQEQFLKEIDKLNFTQNEKASLRYLNKIKTDKMRNFEYFRSQNPSVRPFVAFTPKTIYRNLAQGQGSSFRGEPFSPMLVVEVDDINTDRVYKRNSNNNVFHRHRAWEDLDGDDALPGFKLNRQSLRDQETKIHN
ncbi:14888_t:CDS:2, partial [Funneliformis caledonium]